MNKIFDYLQGNIRYKLYYSKYFNFLIPSHIKEQYRYRLNSMDEECLNNGSCKECGCKTTHLQFANKACGGLCYPKFKNRKSWKKLVGYKNHIYEYDYIKKYYMVFTVSHSTQKFIKFDKYAKYEE